MKPGDVLTAEQARALPDGAVFDYLTRHVVGEGGRGVKVLAYTLVSLPTPPDMAPGSVVLDDEGAAWMRGSATWHAHRGVIRRWDILAPRVVKVLHDAAVPS